MQITLQNGLSGYNNYSVETMGNWARRSRKKLFAAARNYVPRTLPGRLGKKIISRVFRGELMGVELMGAEPELMGRFKSRFFKRVAAVAKRVAKRVGTGVRKVAQRVKARVQAMKRDRGQLTISPEGVSYDTPTSSESISVTPGEVGYRKIQAPTQEALEQQQEQVIQQQQDKNKNLMLLGAVGIGAVILMGMKQK